MMENWSQILLGLECESTRHRTLMEISGLRSPEVAELAVKYLQDHDYLVRLEAFECIFNNDESGRYKDELAQLLNDRESDLRISSIEFLINVKASDQLTKIKRLLSDPDELVRAYAALAVAHLGSKLDTIEMRAWYRSIPRSMREEASFHVFQIIQLSERKSLGLLLQLFRQATHNEKRFISSLLYNIAIERFEFRGIIYETLKVDYLLERDRAVKDSIGKRMKHIKEMQ